MANPPIIVNKRPAEGDANVKALDPVKFGLRDEETRVDLTSLYTSVTYAQAVYRPEVLPLADDVLTTEPIRALFSVFNDAAGATLPLDPSDQTIETVGPDEVYRIERTTGGAQEGFLYISDDAHGDVVYAAEAKIDLSIVSLGTTPYVTYADFTGVMFGLIYWPKSTGVFLFFRDDGSKKITIAGPSTDGIGTRTVETTVFFDWSAAIYTYKILWDQNPFREKILVLATDGITETVLAEIAISSLNQFLDTVVLGQDAAEDPPNRIALVVGTDGPTLGDQIDIYKADLFRFGKPLIVNGGRSGRSELSIFPVETVRLVGDDGIEDWIEEGTGASEAEGETLALTREDSLPIDTYQFFREEPDLLRKEWMIIAAFRAKDSLHPGTFNTGMGFNIEDGTFSHEFRLLDDFFDKNVGYYDTGTKGLLESYLLGPNQLDWEEEDRRLILLGSDSRSYIRGYFEEDEDISIDTGAYSSAIASTESKVSFGFVDDDFDYSGTFNLVYFWVFLNCVFYEPLDATFPEAQGWTRTFSGGTRAIASGRLEIDASTPGDYDIYSVTDVDYNATAGGAAFMKASVSSWTDDMGSTDPPRKEIGPIAAVAVDDQGAQLFFVESETGSRYVYLPGASNDALNVVSQNTAGKAISAELDFTEDHVYLLIVKPFQFVRLYVDYATEPLIDIPWADKAKVLRPLPANQPVGSAVAIGSLGEDSGVVAEIAFARMSLGTGYDLAVTFLATEDELQDHIYGGEAEVLIDFEDNDP